MRAWLRRWLPCICISVLLHLAALGILAGMLLAGLILGGRIQ